MGELILAVEGTAFAGTLAIVLALVSAFAHAAFGALQKGAGDPWTIRGAVDLAILILALPVALFLVPAPSPTLWWVLLGVWAIHTAYKGLQTAAYVRGAYTVVYPIARGSAVLTTVLFAWAAFGEAFTPGQWGGVAVLSAGIMALSLANLRGRALQRETLAAALGLALASGLSIAAYTTYDAWGIRLAADPFTFLAWFFVIDGWTFPLIWLWLRRRTLAAARESAVGPSFPPAAETSAPPELPRAAAPPPLGRVGPIRPHARRAVLGALTAFVSFGCVMLATRLDKVGEAVALRETSVVFAALLGWLFLREPLGPLRAGLMIAIGLGAAAVQVFG
ncbi:MAG: EamA family transporter [Pseudomonadota bacterium]